MKTKLLTIAMLTSLTAVAAPVEAKFKDCELVGTTGDLSRTICGLDGYDNAYDFSLHYGSIFTEAVEIEVARVAPDPAKLEELRSRIKVELEVNASDSPDRFMELPSQVVANQINFPILDKSVSSRFMSVLRISLRDERDGSLQALISEIFGNEAFGLVLVRRRAERDQP
ncbi:MAG TPA: hypothetical protein VM901_09690 [Bdellovibrionota bacterium]|jgi:hypothetical protein|nr:hypothetical protein [Bdellovibrionota bacterium]